MPIGDAVPHPGLSRFTRQIEDIQRRARQNEGAKTAQATEIGSGGLRSADFNGTGVDNPGTRGWEIGRTLGGESYVIINGRLMVGGAAFITGLLTVAGTLAITGQTEITGPLSIEGATTIAGDTTVTGALDVTGDLGVGGDFDLAGDGVVTGALQSSNYAAGSAGWRLTPTTVEINDASFKPQVVPDAALAHIVKGDALTGSVVSTYSPGTITVASASVTVPADVTRAAVSAVSSAQFTSVVADQQIMYTRIAGDNGDTMWTASVDTQGTATSSHARDFAVTPGATLTVDTRILMLETATVRATTTATVIFYR